MKINRMSLMVLALLGWSAPVFAVELPEELRGKYSSDGKMCASLVDEFKNGNGWLGNLEISQGSVTYDNGTNCVPKKVVKSGVNYKIHSQCTGEQDYEEDVSYTVKGKELILTSADYKNRYIFCGK